jgi:TolB-like protein
MADRPESESASGPTEATTDMARHLFISYASHNAEVAQQVCMALEAAGFLCWMAPRDVRPGAQYADAIVGAINNAKAVVLVLSESAVASPHVGREVERAASKHKPLIAFRIDTAPLSRALEYFLSESQWIDVRALGMPAALAKLAVAVGQESATPAHQIPATNRAVTQKRVAVFAAILICIGAAVILGMHFWSLNHLAAQPRTPAAITDKSIAVLPFVDMSEKKDQEYFADGMAEEIIDLLVRIPDLKVIGRTSSFQFKGRNEDLRAIGTKLGVAYVVEGSVRRSGDHIRVTAQLIDTATGAHTWSDHFDRQSGDVLTIQDEIAASLVRALQITVGAANAQLRPILRIPEAYNLYLRGRHALDRTDEEGFEEAIRDFQQALKLDPTSAATAAWLSVTYEMQAEFGLVPPDVGFERARQAAQAALAQEPNLAIAHVTLGGVHTAHDFDWTAADGELHSALALAPGDTMASFYAARLSLDLGHSNEALAEVNAALAADPLWPLPYQGLDWVQARRGHFLEAELAGRRLLELSPTYLSGHYYLGLVLLERGDREGALKLMQQEAPEGGRDGGLAIVYYALGRKAESDATLARLIKMGVDSAVSIAEAYAYRDERDNAIQWLERAYAQRIPDAQYIKGDPWLRNLEVEPRYKALLRKMNLPL